MSEPDSLIHKLWQWGHFRNPAYPDTHDVQEGDLDTLTPADRVVHDAVRSYQEWFSGDIDTQARVMHGRSLIADGEIGPATEAIARQPRCGVPEYATGDGPLEANWPDACRLEITVSYSLSALNLTAAQIRQEWVRALDAWEQVIGVRFVLQDSFSQSSRIWARARPLPGSTLAWSYLATNDCNARLEQAYDTTTRWSQGFLQATIGHEVGHALGAGHSRSQRSLMYPSITDIVTPQADDVAAMTALGYGDPVKPAPPEPPPTPDIPPGRGVFVTEGGTTYILLGIRQ